MLQRTFHVLLVATAWGTLVVPAAAQWDIECDPGAVPEDEPDCGIPVDTVDGGCLTIPSVFWPIQCGQVICGTSAGSWPYTDDDWYEIQLTEPTVITWTVTAEFAPRIAVKDGTAGCDDYYTIVFTNGEPVEPISLAAAVEPGTYWLVVRPLSYPVDCGAEYQAELTCEPVVYGACCLPDGACADLPAVTCDWEEGTYLGDGTSCAADTCPNGPGACCLADGSCSDGLAQVECEALDGIFYGGGSVCEAVACCVYPDQSFTQEGEPICYDGYFDDYNGGCDPPGDYAFYAQWIDYGDCIVGHSGTYLNADGEPERDMDLYQMCYCAEMTTARCIWRVTPTFPAEIGFVAGSAFGPPICPVWGGYETTATAEPCETAIINVGKHLIYDVYHAMYVRPQAGVEVPCGAPYVATLTYAPLEDVGCGYQRRGDANCDGAVDFDDIDPFVLALSGQEAWEAVYGGIEAWWGVEFGYLCVNDCNADGVVDFDDIDAFVELLLGG